MTTSQDRRRVAVVTGGYRGIGGATRKELAAQGHTAVSIDLRADPGDPLQYACDIADLDALRATLERIEAEHGLIEVLVNNAAIFHGKSVFELTPELFDRSFAVNVRAAFFAAQHVARRLVAHERPGAIVNISSAAGRAGSPYVDYGASKAAVIGMTQSLGKALAAHGIRVNAVAPGQVLTDLHRSLTPERQQFNLQLIPMKRSGEPEELARVIAFLASDGASFMTSAIVDVNGGKL
jgi:NAD(P)-dependent dehydrogenase (short-subunit alcohol dehydrogenase family)